MNLKFIFLFVMFVVIGKKANSESIDAKKISIDLYYESLCGGCNEFIVDQLVPTYYSLKEIIDIDLIPFGNAVSKIQSDSTIVFECHHGPNECLINTYMSCGLNLIKDFDKNLLFIYCLQKTADVTSIENCAKSARIDYERLKTCVNSDEGKMFLKEESDKTNALKPSLEYTPWIVINKQHNDSLNDLAQDNLKKLVCDLYEGPKPPNCLNKIETVSEHSSFTHY